MSTTTTVALSQQMALQRNMDVIANNLANMSTTAFKTESVIFAEYLMDVETETGTEQVSYVIDSGVDRDISQGHQAVTTNPFDFAINGNGYFVIETENGNRYTRNGHFSLNELGQLSTKEGNAVLDKGGSPILLSPEESDFFVSSDGSVSTSAGSKGQIAIVEFEDQASLLKEGDSLWTSTEEPNDAENPVITQGSIEQSNVSAIVEMTKMIDVSRAYQTAAKLAQQNNDLITKAINELSSPT
jgi:flagellar basal-body rod protein FlgF